jgi:hypothetical protein
VQSPFFSIYVSLFVLFHFFSRIIFISFTLSVHIRM